MGNGWTGGRWSDLEGGTWLRESWGAKKCDGNGRCGMGSGRMVKGLGKGTRRVERRRWEIGGREEEETWLRDKDGNGGLGAG